MAVHKSLDDKFILSYLQKINLSQSRNIDHFWSNLYTNYDKGLVDELKDIVKERVLKRKAGNDLYNYKNQDLKLSIDFSSYCSDIYRKYFLWLMQRKDLKPKRILDIGCDNGIISCFYGILYPEAEVIGIDIEERGIDCSKELAAKLNLHNVHFQRIPLEEIDSHFEKDSFDMISFIRGTFDIFHLPSPNDYWSLDEVKIESPSDVEKKLLSNIANLLSKENGEFICCDSFVTVSQFLWIANALKEAALYIDSNASTKVSYVELGNSRQINILSARKENTSSDFNNDMINLFIKDQVIDINKKKIYDDVAAEILFNKIEDKILISGLQVNYRDKSGTQRIELWQAKNLLFRYRTSNLGFRELHIYDNNQLEEAKEDIKTLSETANNLKHEYFVYSSLKERDILNIKK